MKLDKFIKKLQEIKNREGNNVEVIMADNIPVVAPVFIKNFVNKKVVIITDEK